LGDIAFAIFLDPIYIQKLTGQFLTEFLFTGKYPEQSILQLFLSF